MDHVNEYLDTEYDLGVNSAYQGGNFGHDLFVLVLLLSKAHLQSSHLLFKLSNGVVFVNIHRFHHLQLSTQLRVLELTVFQVNLMQTQNK